MLPSSVVDEQYAPKEWLRVPLSLQVAAACPLPSPQSPQNTCTVIPHACEIPNSNPFLIFARHAHVQISIFELLPLELLPFPTTTIPQRWLLSPHLLYSS
jgi:hypothetical protein